MSGTVTSDTIFLVSTAMDAKSVFINSLHTWEAHHILPPPWNSVLSWLLFQCVCWESALTHCANEAIKLRNSRQDKTFRNKTHCGVLMCLRFSLFLFVCLFVCLFVWVLPPFLSFWVKFEPRSGPVTHKEVKTTKPSTSMQSVVFHQQSGPTEIEV